jgi:hypothetical protein
MHRTHNTGCCCCRRRRLHAQRKCELTFATCWADALRKDIIKPSLYADNPEELMVGMLAALLAAAVWLVLATFLNLPVSTTHGMGMCGISSLPSFVCSYAPDSHV